MKRSLTFCLLMCSMLCSLLSCAQKKTFNIDAETLDQSGKKPKDWLLSLEEKQNPAYAVKLDSVVKKLGNHSISIERLNNKFSYGAIGYVIKDAFEGKRIELKGYIKMEQVDSGSVGLWMRIDGVNGPLAYDYMEKEHLNGTSDWKQYSIALPYDVETAKVIHIGGLLQGKGKVWFDGFELFIDGKPINEVPVKPVVLPKAALDTAFSTSSGITSFKINSQIVDNLTMAGQFWGFLKYYHPSIAKGDYNWDAELFRFLPQVIKAKNNIELSNVLETYMEKLGTPVPFKNKTPWTDEQIAMKPDYGHLFNGSVFSASLTEKLLAVRNSAGTISHYYISMMPGVGNPKFENEKSYAQMAYPDAGYRILSLYRYWAMINYFFPYKDIIGVDWSTQLRSSIPGFVEAKDAQGYVLTTLKLISSVNDTHANIWRSNKELNDFKGRNKLPIKAKFIEDKLVVTGYYGDTLNVKQKFKIGDVILAINGRPLEQLIKEFLPYTAASNYDTKLRDLPDNYLLRGNVDRFSIKLNREGEKRLETINAVAVDYFMKSHFDPEPPAFKLLSKKIGYVYPGKYKNTDLFAIKNLFKDTKGMIIDMRCYPSDFMPFTFGNYLKSLSNPFVKFSSGQLSQPGLFTYSQPLNNGSFMGDTYKGKVIVIVNSTSQSQAEYTTIAFQSSPNVTVIGSTTAGADGNISPIILPGNIYTVISGIGIFYPDGSPTQRVGVKIDYVLKPTIKGTVAGRDELLEKAKEMLGYTAK